MAPPESARSAVLGMVASRIPSRGPACVLVAVDGPDGSGKTTFADELAAVVSHAPGPPTIRIGLDDFHRVRAHRYRRGRDSPDGFYLDSFNVDRFVADVPEPLRNGHRYRPRAHDVDIDQVLDPPWEIAPPGSVVIVDGMFLQRPELAGHFDLTVFLDVPFEVTARRMALRDGPSPRGNDRYVGGCRRYYAECDPHGRADVLIDNTDLAAPRILRG